MVIKISFLLSRIAKAIQVLIYSPDEIANQRINYIRDHNELRFIKRIELDLGVVRDKYEIEVYGDVLLVQSTDGTASVYFNDDDTNYVELDKVSKMYMDFWRIFITNTEQAGKTMTLLVGMQGVFDGVSDVAKESSQINMNNKLGDIETKVSDVETSVDENKTQVTNVHSRLALLRDDVGDVQTAVENNKTVLDNILTKTTNNETTLNNISNDTGQLPSDPSKESGKLTTIEDNQKKSWAITASEDLLLSSDSEVYWASGGGASNKEKEIAILRTGIYRVKVEGKEVSGNGTVELWIDGIEQESLPLTTSYAEKTFTDILLSAGEYLQLYLDPAIGGAVYGKNFRIYGEATGAVGVVTLEDGS